jgi:hypothetical protein
VTQQVLWLWAADSHLQQLVPFLFLWLPGYYGALELAADCPWTVNVPQSFVPVLPEFSLEI